MSRVLAAYCWTIIVSLLLGVMYFWFRLLVTSSLDSAFSAFSVGSTRWFSMVFSTSTPKVQKCTHLDNVHLEEPGEMRLLSLSEASIQEHEPRQLSELILPPISFFKYVLT